LTDERAVEQIVHEEMAAILHPSQMRVHQENR